MPEPSPTPVLVAVVLGLVSVGACIRWRRRHPVLIIAVTGVMAAAALVVGAWQTMSLPAETGPPITAWALPASAAAFPLAAMLRRWTVFTRASFVLVAAAQLGVWFVARRHTLNRAVLPTSAPFWLDRSVTAAAAVVALAGAAIGVATVIAEMGRRPGAGRVAG